MKYELTSFQLFLNKKYTYICVSVEISTSGAVDIIFICGLIITSQNTFELNTMPESVK